MFGELLGDILAAPLRIANIPVKAVKMVADDMCGDRPTNENNLLDDIADGVSENTKKF